MIENTDNQKQAMLAVLAAVTGLILIFIVPDQVMLPINIAFAEFYLNANAINSAHSLSLGLLQFLYPLLSAPLLSGQDLKRFTIHIF